MRPVQRPHLLLFLVALLSLCTCTTAFLSSSFTITGSRTTTQTANAAVKIEGYDEAFDEIDRCSTTGETSEKLYDAVRFIDKNARTIYPTLDHKQQLWQEAFGSWKLQLATGGGRFTTFKPVPIFAFAMIDENNFGNGVGLNENTILLSLLGPHYFNEKTRQMVITIDNMFVAGGNKVTKFLPGFIADGMGLGKKPQDYEKPSRPPAFTMIGASDKSLIARGGSGGIAIWTRLPQDIRPVAYKLEQVE